MSLLLKVIVFAERILISDSDEDPQVSWWIEELWLHKHDQIILLSGEELTDNIINRSTAPFEQVVSTNYGIFSHNLNY